MSTGSKTFSFFYTPTGDGSYITNFKFENVYVSGKCMTKMSDFPNGGMLTYGQVTNFTFTCSWYHSIAIMDYKL